MPHLEWHGNEMMADRTNITVIIATINRPDIVSQTVHYISTRQVLKPTEILISVVCREDAGTVTKIPTVRTIIAPAGLAAQRNAALSEVNSNTDIVVFFDDDFLPDSTWLKNVADIFHSEFDVVCVTGNVVADGIKGPGFSFSQADKLLREVGPVKTSPLIDGFSPYGCNMAFRRNALDSLRFDERLVLYGWLEDRDFGARLSKKGGRLVKCMQMRGIHLGVKSGRIAGQRLGYSQIINPLYLVRKGTMQPGLALIQITRNLISNVFGSIVPEPYIDRRGRLRGNVIGIYDAVRGILEPERAKDII